MILNTCPRTGAGSAGEPPRFATGPVLTSGINRWPQRSNRPKQRIINQTAVYSRGALLQTEGGIHSRNVVNAVVPGPLLRPPKLAAKDPNMTLHTPALRATSVPGGAKAPPTRHLPDPRPAIDLVHLARQTLGDRDLELELLGLFAQQARSIVTTLATQPRDTAQLMQRSNDLLHTLCGSARAVGAWDVADEAQSVETSQRSALQDEGSRSPAQLTRLQDRVRSACAVIDDLLQDHV